MPYNQRILGHQAKCADNAQTGIAIMLAGIAVTNSAWFLKADADLKKLQRNQKTLVYSVKTKDKACFGQVIKRHFFDKLF